MGSGERGERGRGGGGEGEGERKGERKREKVWMTDKKQSCEISLKSFRMKRMQRTRK